MIKLKEATKSDVKTIIKFLKEMNDETKEFEFNNFQFTQSVEKSFDENVNWFLFYNEIENPFGLCYCQSVHNYWSIKKRFYLGGFYIYPTHRKKGHFRELNKQLKQWVTKNNGVQIYTHINKDNEHSSESFKSVDFEEIEYDLYANHWGK